MKVKIVFEFDDQFRKAVAHHYGKKGKASYQDMKTWVEMSVNGTGEDISADYQKATEAKEDDE